jgi:hypothetical protein
MLPRWLDGSAATQLGTEIAKDIQALIPAGKDNKGGHKNPAKRLQKLARIVDKTTAESRKQRFNFYQKAKFANALRWSLKDGGYPPDLIEEVIGLLLARM